MQGTITIDTRIVIGQCHIRAYKLEGLKQESEDYRRHSILVLHFRGELANITYQHEFSEGKTQEPRRSGTEISRETEDA